MFDPIVAGLSVFPLAQLLFLVLSNDKVWVDKQLGRIAEVLSALDGGEQLCRDWWKDWASRRVANVCGTDNTIRRGLPPRAVLQNM